MTDYTELKRLVDRVLTDRRFCGDENHKAIAGGANALIAENERLERLALDSVSAEYEVGMDLESICAERDQLRAEVAGLKTGYEAYERVNAELKAENEALRAKWENPDPILIQCMDSVMAEQEQLEKDAERYRWLRSRESADDPEISVTRWTQLATDRAVGEAPRLEVLDAAIDAAMGKGEQS